MDVPNSLWSVKMEEMLSRYFDDESKGGASIIRRQEIGVRRKTGVETCEKDTHGEDGDIFPSRRESLQKEGERSFKQREGY